MSVAVNFIIVMNYYINHLNAFSAGGKDIFIEYFNKNILV